MKTLNVERDYRTHPLEELDKISKPAWSWALVIAAGIFIGNIATGITVKLYFDYEARQVLAALKAKTAERTSTTAAQARERQIQAETRRLEAEQRKIEQQNQRDAVRQASEVCSFWQSAVAREDTAYNRSMRDSACARLQSLR